MSHRSAPLGGECNASRVNQEVAMRMRSAVMSGLLIASPGLASAQTEFAGAQKCDAPKPQYAIPVGDRPNHVMSLVKDKCTWTKGEIAGVMLKDEEDVIASNLAGGVSHDKGYGTARSANGDKLFVQFKGTTMFKDTLPETGRGTWKFTGGTGKLKGIKGDGTFTGQYHPDGTSTFEIKGTYRLSD
jgi:hypothetical protein